MSPSPVTSIGCHPEGIVIISKFHGTQPRFQHLDDSNRILSRCVPDPMRLPLRQRTLPVTHVTYSDNTLKTPQGFGIVHSNLDTYGPPSGSGTEVSDATLSVNNPGCPCEILIPRHGFSVAL